MGGCGLERAPLLSAHQDEPASPEMLPVAGDGNLPHLSFAFAAAHTQGICSFPLWDQVSGSSSLFLAAVSFHFAKRFLTD